MRNGTGTPDRHVTSSGPLSLVLRLLVTEAARGAVVGHAEVVDTGEVVPIRRAADVAALAQRLAERRASGDPWGNPAG
jgi:hypothetical protein